MRQELHNDDRRLLEDYALRGVEQAFATIVARYTSFVYCAALRKAGNHETAEEVTQNVFAILARKARLLSDKSVLAGWLHRTTMYECSHALRKETSRKRKMEAFAQHQALQVEMSDSQTIENVDSALAKLPQLDQNILLLRFYHGLSFREIGKQLGKSEDASQKLSSRALEKLGRVLQGRGLSASVAVVAATLTAEFAKAAPVGVASKVAKGAIASAPTLTKVALTLHTIEIMNYAKTKFTAVLTTFSIASITIIWLLSNTTAQEEIKGKAKARQPVWVASIKFVERLEVDYRFALIFIGPEIQFSRRTPPVKNWFLNLKTTTGDGRFTLIKVIPPGEDPVAAPGQVVLIDNFRVDGNPLKLRCGPVVVRPEYQARIRNKATGKEVSVRLNEQFRLPGVEEDLTVSGISEDSVEISFPEKDGKERRKIILKK